MSLRDQLQDTLGSAYTLERELGGGGMSRVFVAEEAALGRKVVIKVLPPEVAAGVSAERFRREIQLAARLQHPHIVPVLSSGETEGLPYYTMPFVEGESVRARLTRLGAFPVSEVVSILRDVARALAYAHERGIVHRDIKPDNVLLSGGAATVADFGIAKAIAAARSEGDGAAPTLTQIGSALGTPAYMAPEQAAADPATNHRADIYAFGCMAYEMLAGRPPFVAKTPQRLLAAQMSDQPQPLAAHRADLPADLTHLVMACLAKDADARPQHATDLLRVLETVTSGHGHDAMPRVLLGGRGMLGKALAAYAAAFVFVAVLARAAIVGIGLPDWVFPGALVVMGLGLPVILLTAYAHRQARIAATETPTYTPGGTRRSSGTVATLALKAGPHLSWRRTWLGGLLAVGTFVLLIAGYMVSRATGVGPFASLFASGALQRNEKVLVADFGGSTDSALGPVVTEAFRTALSQSRSISVIQPNEIRDVLQRMRRPTTTRLDFAVAREIASREGVKAVVDGQILNVGGNYALSVRLMSPQTGQMLANLRETASGDDELLPAIDKLARDLRERIGESLKSVQTTIPLERVTTPSLEALKKYVQGSRLMSFEGDFPRGAALLEEAIALDTGFAMAYRRLAVEYSNRNQPDRAIALLQKAYDHSDRLSDAERYLVLGSYYQRGPKQDLARSTAAYEALIELQPDHITPLNNVAINYRWQRDWPKAEAVLKRAIQIGNAPAVTHNQLIWTLLNQGKRAEAWTVLERYDTLYPTNLQRVARRAELLVNDRQFDSAATLARGSLRQIGDSPQRALILNGLVAVLRTQGKLREGARVEDELLVAQQQRGIAERDLQRGARLAAERLFLFNDPAGAIARVEQALQRTPLEGLAPSVRPYLELAGVYAHAGRADRVRELLASFERSREQEVATDDEVTRSALRGYVALADRRYAEAARVFQQSDRGDCLACALPEIANTYDLAGEPDSAVAVFERYVSVGDQFRLWTDQWFLAGSHKRLGELYEARGDRANALSHYLRFVELWKGADPEFQPRVAQVRARIARLRDSERSSR